jgi:hypothetical protein
MGAYDNMFSNSSTFKVELDECCKILRDATPKSLVILDGKPRISLWCFHFSFRFKELGRGTSTFVSTSFTGPWVVLTTLQDGMAIAGVRMYFPESSVEESHFFNSRLSSTSLRLRPFLWRFSRLTMAL